MRQCGGSVEKDLHLQKITTVAADKNGGGLAMVKKRSIVLSVILSFVTFGLYGLYWIIKVTNEMNSLLYKRNATGGLMAVVFTIVTFGLYGFLWAYRLGENVDNLKRDSRGNSAVLYLIVYILGFGIVDLVLAQDAINTYLDGQPGTL